MIIFMHTKQTNLSLCKEAYWAHYLFLGPSSAPPPQNALPSPPSLPYHCLLKPFSYHEVFILMGLYITLHCVNLTG